MKILKKEIISSSKYLNFVATKFINKNNEESIWYSAERNNGGKTVVIAAIADNDKLVVTKEFRVPIGGYEWALPAGLVDENESIETTAIRELKEETNLELTKIVKITPYMTNSAGLTNEMVSIVFAYAKGEINQSGNEQSEEIETFLMSKVEVKQLMNDKSKTFSAKAWLIFDKFINQGW
ncbi:MAG: NUDIX hydrolase [Bacteroidales bacterium]|nr:NUDIX hydrolase [Bacteroidales bacterium]